MIGPSHIGQPATIRMSGRREFDILLVQADGVATKARRDVTACRIESLSRAEAEKFEAVSGGNHGVVATRNGRLP